MQVCSHGFRVISEVKMSEIDSFIGKFRHLWYSGKSASVFINSEAGKLK